MKFIKILKANEVPNRVLELLQESYQENCKPLAYLSTRGGKTEIVISKDKFGINITTYIDGKSQSSDNSISDLDSHWTKYYSNDINKEFGQPLYKLIWSDPSLDTSIFTKMKKESAIQQPNKPKPTTTLPDNMEWSWDPNAADWVAVMKNNTNVTPPLYNPQNQNLVNQNTTSYMSTVKSSNNYVDESTPEYESRVREAYKQLAGMIEETDILADYAKRSGDLRLFDAYIQLGHEVANEWDVKPEAVFGEMVLSSPELPQRLADIDKENFNKENEEWLKKHSSKKLESTSVDGLDFPIKTWYTHVFKQDKLGEEIDPNVTFQDVLDNPQNVYKLLGVGDSTIRERVFTEISRKTNKSGDDIYNRWLGQVKSSCLSQFLDGPRYSKEIKIEAGLIKEGLLKYAGFDFNRGTKYAITNKGLEVLRKSSESEHNEALNEREKLAYLFGFNTDEVSTLDTTGKVLKQATSKKWTICEADGTELGEVEADSELDAKVKFGIEHPEYADSQSICAKEIKSGLEYGGSFEYNDYKIDLFNDIDGGATFVIYAPKGKTVNNESMYKGTASTMDEAITKAYKIIDGSKEINAQYEQTTEQHLDYPNPSETPVTDTVIENHTGWVNTADQKVTPEFAKLHELLGKYKGENLIQLADVDGNLVASGDPQVINNLEHEVKDIGYYCESVSEDTDSDYAETYSLKIFMK